MTGGPSSLPDPGCPPRKAGDQARVIAGASTPEKLAVAREHGTDALVDYATEPLTDRVMALTDGKGADVCFDPVGGGATSSYACFAEARSPRAEHSATCAR